jgi:small-conductance mechanosensitive channel
MSVPLFEKLLTDLTEDFHDINFLWQVGVVVSCFLLALLVSRFVKKAFSIVDSSSSVKLGVKSISTVFVPSFFLLLLLIAKVILGKWQHTNLLNLLFPIVGSFALVRFGLYVVRHAFAREGRISKFLAIFEQLFAVLVAIGVVLYFTGLGQDLVAYLDDIVIPFGRKKITFLEILQTIASVTVTLILAMWASAALEARLMILPAMHSSLKVVFSRLGRVALILVAILVSLSIVGIDLTVLSVFGGALGVGLGFGLQKITSSYISGFIILLDGSMSIGDMISVDKFNGEITDIKTRYTVLKGSDGGESIIPNEMLVSNPVQNYSLTDRSVVMTTDLTVAYDTDIESLLPMLESAAASVERVSSKNAPSAYLLKFGADGLDLRVGFWIVDPENGRTNVLSDVNRAIWKMLQLQSIELPYPQRVITVNDAFGKVLDLPIEKA